MGWMRFARDRACRMGKKMWCSLRLGNGDGLQFKIEV